MTGRVGIYPPSVTDQFNADNRIQIATPPLGKQATQLGRLANWLLGRGSSLVISGPTAGVSAVSTAITYHFFTWPSEPHYARLWTVSLCKAGANANVNLSGTITTFDGGVHVWSIGEDVPVWQCKTFYAVEIVDPPNGNPEAVEFDLTLDSVSGEDVGVNVMGIACYEIPRNLLADYGGGSIIIPDLDSLAVGRLIYDPVSDKGIARTCRAMVQAKSRARRSCFHSTYYPLGVSSTDTAFSGTSNVFGSRTANNPPVLARHLHDGETTRTINWAAYMQVTGGLGQVQVTSSKTLDSAQGAIGTIAGWVAGEIDVETEDLSRIDIDGGIRGGTREELIVEIRRTTGTSITLYGFCAGEGS